MFASIPLWQTIPWRTIYVINAGRPTDIDAYLPKRLHPMAKRKGLIPAGFFYIPHFGMSFIVGSPSRYPIDARNRSISIAVFRKYFPS